MRREFATTEAMSDDPVPDAPAYSYRQDCSVPDFDDTHPILVFDGVCVLCSASFRFVLRHDRRQDFRFVVAQSPLGQALYRHYGLDPLRLDTVLAIADGRLHTRLGAFAAVMRRLPWPWRIFSLSRFLRWPLGDRAYDWVGRNRYRWFGRNKQCMLPSQELRSRFLSGGWTSGPGS